IRLFPDVGDPAEIEAAVVNLLRFHEAETAMLFCATRDNVRRLHATLVERGFTAVALSGEHSQSERNNALQALRDRRARVCVATDVAARGIDLPSLSLVVHVEIPRDAETLQHRSGRTGRAGKKGTAVLIVPFPRRRRVEMMLRGAKINAEWADVPTPEAIRAQDRERLLETILAPVEMDEADVDIARTLLEQRTPEELATALVRAHRASLPQPEELLSGSDDGRKQAAHRPGFDDVVWFRMDVGRRQNADPRWILPTLCRRGHVSRQEIGAIRIAPNDTWFQVPRAIADRFADAVRRTADPRGEDENGIHIEVAPDGPREIARDNRRGNDGPRRNGPHHDGPRSDDRRPPRRPHPAGQRPQGKPHRKGPQGSR
ncbi:MAG: helicase-related protein, partial [Novosphingobium sp.]|uniref:helicase-related protein n=1 Tax=Novosphingobium sp. TaxID=1874826 RepID=UPI003B9D06CD